MNMKNRFAGINQESDEEEEKKQCSQDKEEEKIPEFSDLNLEQFTEKKKKKMLKKTGFELITSKSSISSNHSQS